MLISTQYQLTIPDNLQIRLDIQVDEKTGKITKSAFKTFGCGSAIASSSYLTTLLAGKTCTFIV